MTGNDLIFSGRRNPLRMLSNAMDFRSRKRGNHRPKSADFERVSENPAGKILFLGFFSSILAIRGKTGFAHFPGLAFSNFGLFPVLAFSSFWPFMERLYSGFAHFLCLAFSSFGLFQFGPFPVWAFSSLGFFQFGPFPVLPFYIFLTIFGFGLFRKDIFWFWPFP